MKTQLPCSVVQELLPLHAEGLLRAENTELVQEHLRHCPACSKALGEMTADQFLLPQRHTDESVRLEAARPLKKFRFRFWMNLLGAPLWLPLALTAVLLLLTLVLLVYVALLLLWVIPAVSAVVAIAALPLLLKSLLLAQMPNSLFSIGLLCLGIGLAMLGYLLCRKCTVWLWRGTLALIRRFRKKQAKTRT